MTNVLELNVGESIDMLDLLALKGLGVDIDKQKFDRACKSLETLYKKAQESIMDQEKAYIYMVRFFYLYDKFSKNISDETFMRVRFPYHPQRSKILLEQLRADLIKRYGEKKALEGGTEKSVKKEIAKSTVPKNIFSGEYITCSELYRALKQPNNMLLVDARPQEDFEKSKISIGHCINVPDHCIQSGMSAHRIGLNLPSETQVVWDQRDIFDVIVLIDWNSTAETIIASKLDKLRSSLVEWDTNKNYLEKPVVLSGGYMEWFQMYPSVCSNGHMIINKINTELDELLDLDIIQYPTEETKIPIITFQDENKVIAKKDDSTDLQTREELLKRNKEISKQSEQVINQLIDKEKTWKDLNNQHSETNQSEMKELEKTIFSLDQELETLMEQKTKVQDDFEFYAGFDPSKETLVSDDIKEIVDIDTKDNEKFKIRETIAKQRLEELAKARALKPKSSSEVNVHISNSNFDVVPKVSKTDTPLINRATKPHSKILRPRFMDGTLSFKGNGGLIGLRNIRNTCYMNTVVQCMRNIPILSAIFCSGQYSKHVTRKPDAIIMETGYLFRSLWSSIHKYFDPINFYEKVCALEPMYKLGNHEDCMEFFLFFLNHLSEDCSYDIKRPDVMTPLQQAWCNQLCGKNSIFNQLFYHQIRITQICRTCNRTTYKFEMESTFMLSVPESDFKVEDLMRNYLQDYVIDDYCCAKCKKPVINSKGICVAPKILVIVLKRYKQSIRNNNVTVSKIESRSNFPKTRLKFGEYSYNLNAIAMHSGSLTSGHYTAACLVNKRWHEFNDEIVRPIDIDDEDVKSKACAFFYSEYSEK